MGFNRRVLVGAISPPPPESSSQKPAEVPPAMQAMDADFVVILAAMLCALICVLGLIAVARCAWIRRLGGGESAASSLPAAANKGLKKKVLNSLPKTTFAEDSKLAAKLSDCAICLSDFSAGEELRVLPQCGHGFHVVCIDTWLGSHSSCPSCRQILVAARCQNCQCSQPPPVAAACSGASRLQVQPLPRENRVNLFLP
ncbi:hypothetical protein M569_05824 [Genlisea aurea]|uniref:RING-type E3 ubiquitin transferase n=1 Tax=Genlisea aurea TaxID=192259 RepID=S8E005_9LAMI|nr:hypothetical protein M569_05824 [Genlisea aurea]